MTRREAERTIAAEALYHASFQVFAEGASRSQLVWITDVLPHALAAEIRPRVERGANIMKQTLEEEAARKSDVFPRTLIDFLTSRCR